VKKRTKKKPPKPRSPVPPPGRVLDETSYKRQDNKRRLRKAIDDLNDEDKP